MDRRLKNISALLSDYSLGKFDKKIKLSARQDHIDGIIFTLNMLGEELTATTVSRDYFTNIFHSVSDIIIVLDTSLLITNTNKIFEAALGHKIDTVINTAFEKIINPEDFGLLTKKLNRLNFRQRSFVTEMDLIATTGQKKPFLLTVSMIFNERKKRIGFLVIARDYSYQKEVESMVMRSIIDTQEKERTRFAKDIHDSVGQQISAVKFYIGSSINNATSAEQRKTLEKSNELLLNMIEEIRNLCFAIMPKTLEDFGLVKTVKELVKKIGSSSSNIEFQIKEARHFPAIDKTREIILYRIIQEFISNTLKHAKANSIVIEFRHIANNIQLILSDNGVGFNPEKIRKHASGLKNIKSRVIACQGTIAIESNKKQGTRFEINLSLNNPFV